MAKKAPLNPKQLRPLVDKLHKKLTQNIKKKPVKLNTELKKLVDNFNKKSKDCKLSLKDLLKGISKPKKYSKKDWDRWAGYHKGKWIKGTPEKGTEDNATWKKANVKGKQTTQEVEWHSSKRPKGYNITFSDGRVGGLDPKPGAKHLWEHFGLPFDLGKCCKFILWVVWKDPKKTQLAYFLEWIDCKGNKISVTFDTVVWGYGRWEILKNTVKKPSKER